MNDPAELALAMTRFKGQTAMTTMIETFGVIRADGTLELPQKLDVRPGRVKVRVESVEAPVKPQETLVEFVERSRRELQAAGHKFMNDDEVTAYVEEMRNDDDRIEELYRQGSESR